MLFFLPAPLRGIIALCLYTLSLCITSPWLFVFIFFKFIIPHPAWRSWWNKAVHWVPSLWIAINNLIMRLTTRTQFDIQGLENLESNSWYILISNHQSWIDILMLFKIFDRKIPMPRFFLKKELLWLPIVGQCCWILDFPFMERYSKEKLAKNPELRGKDIETTRRACEKFKHIPITLVNFVEGTRFTQAKHNRQKSPYHHLLKPKAGGIAFAMAAMAEEMRVIIDVTFAYDPPRPTFWQFCCGRVNKVFVRIKTYPITPDLIGDYMNDNQFRIHFQGWLNQVWEEKDKLINKIENV